MSVFTCISCRVAFADADLQRQHYKTDWHRYNLKRKVAELPPVTAENFRQRVLAQKSQVEEAEKDNVSRCQICKKKFNTENAYKTHIKSKKHQEAEKSYNPDDHNVKHSKKNSIDSEEQMETAGTLHTTDKRANSKNVVDVAGSSIDEEADMSDDADSDVESWNSEDGEPLPIEECLFCTNVSSSLEENVKHMTVNHSFFIPDADYLIDLEGLISYLGEKVGVANMCLWCNTRGKSFYSKQAAKNHMVDKGHSKMLHEGESVFEYSDFYDYRKSYPDHAERNEEDEQMELGDTPDLGGDGYELVLPSGATIGHRSLARYYKQRLRPTRSHQHKAIMPSVLSHYRALGWTGATGAMIERRKKDITYVQKLRNKQSMQLGLKANKLFRNYKPQNPI
ncbi:hypothetical protein SNE40_023195 [Patella caerulea]|uniref:C2H2-type domain-containing protein n=1 Tax=Patella caerulea TaxID=87958 RepID=A0AAN8G2E8_PATCE